MSLVVLQSCEITEMFALLVDNLGVFQCEGCSCVV